MSTTATDRAGSPVREMHNHIGGRWVAATGAGGLEVLNPADGAALATVPLSSAADVDAAVAAARAALPQWSRRPVIERARLLFRLRQLVEERLEDFAELLTRDTGKALLDARLEMMRALETIECACAIPQTMQGRALGQIANGVDCETFRQPVGVCAAITPFNFPAMLTMWFLPFAIGCGNTLVLKPSEQTPLVPELIFELLEQLELPPGVVNLVHGGEAAVNALLDAPGVDAVSFVGSAATAAYVYERAAATGKRVQAFGGAKNYMVVMPDAVADKVAANIVASAFGGAGQRCMAGSVILAVDGAWEQIREPLVAAADRLRVGDGMQAGTDLGPVVSQDARARVTDMIEIGVDEGASLALDGRGPVADPNGAFVGPTVLENVSAQMLVAREEIFGPVLSVIPVASLDEAIALVNASRYGNGTSIFTESGAVVRRYREEVEVGMIGVNIGVAAPVAFFPFGGWKSSFLGDVGACGTDAIDFFTRKKTVTSRWFSGGQTGKYFVES
ncbi:CoA-acylating methylmalonate-semialdehyde dehydrogenase [Conexibacter sp. CPCC 206217]|uniref:CoA-acylating methylmalonate-semialdehyde dehydrogenase n=1 Tax=Conexibacter sp. CPCC 206217 TaxID=3064574 RepID=UPI002724BD18|nr:CoA-acylating methylmalonate-semialdehyde dehydrogenase [Conexibacter sp. CPCC 206217]MDO8210094.1 CoA-acylating methylmalonate-semialdehyde dehydrogenase [Conexibacter sp. CPCC 206217]